MCKVHNLFEEEERLILLLEPRDEWRSLHAVNHRARVQRRVPCLNWYHESKWTGIVSTTGVNGPV